MVIPHGPLREEAAGSRTPAAESPAALPALGITPRRRQTRKTKEQNQKRRWLSKPNGGEILIAFLFNKICRRAVPDLGRFLDEYFTKFRRRKGEQIQA